MAKKVTNSILNINSNYLQIVKWVWRDAIRPNQRRIRWITFLQIISVITSFGGFAALYFYVDLIEANHTVQFLQYTFAPRNSQFLLITFASMVGLLFLSTAILDYAFHKQLIQFNQLFETRCVARLYESVIKKAKILPYQNRPVLSPYNIKKSLIKDTKFYGRALFAIIKAIIPLTKLVFSLAFMFYLAFSFTFLVFTLMLIGGLFLWRVSKSVVKETKRKEKHIKIYIRELANALIRPIPSHQLLSQEGAQNYFDAFYSWLLNTQQNRLVINTLIASTTFLLLLIVGHLTLFGNTSWALLVGYFLALRYFLNSLQGINGILKQLSTFYDYIRNYYAILSALSKLDESNFDLTNQKKDANNDYFQFHPDDDEGDDLVDDF